MMELTPHEIARNVHAHPTLSETLMEAAHGAEVNSDPYLGESEFKTSEVSKTSEVFLCQQEKMLFEQ